MPPRVLGTYPSRSGRGRSTDSDAGNGICIRTATAVRAAGLPCLPPAIAKLATGRAPSHVQTERHDLKRLVRELAVPLDYLRDALDGQIAEPLDG